MAAGRQARSAPAEARPIYGGRMRTRRRRHVAAFVVVGCSLLVGAVAALGAVVGDAERITSFQVAAVLGNEGLLVTEVIDYDFGPSPRRGIYRDIPDAAANSVSVRSSTAPDQTLVTERRSTVHVRVGDPSVTITGRHRYQIEYLLPFDAVVQGNVLAWDAVGTRWTVPIRNVGVELALAGELENASCSQGRMFEERRCELANTGSAGRYTVRIDELGVGDGVTISGSLVTAGAPPELVPSPSSPVDDPGIGILLPFVVATAAAIVGGFGGGVIARRAGRERVWSGGAADAAFGDERDELVGIRIDELELAELATIEFEPPRDTSATEGGIIFTESVRDQHLSAWLLEAAIRGEIEISGDTRPVLTRGSSPAHPQVHQVLDAMFGSRSTITLDDYDKTFATGWKRLRNELDEWFDGAAHWDADGRRNRRRAIGLGVLTGTVGLALTAVTAAFAARSGGLLTLAVIAAAALTGVAVGLVASSSELMIRTEAGTALWLRIESFRRFLQHSEARHVTEAAQRGVLRHYTAWAVALGESQAWADAVEAATTDAPELGSSAVDDIAFVSLGSHIGHATSKTTTVPASSGGSDWSGGGGFSGSVGGGGGGGGGGSW